VLKVIDVKLGGVVTRAINLFEHVEKAKTFVRFHDVDKSVTARYIFIKNHNDYILYFYKEIGKVSSDYASQLEKIEAIVKNLFESVEALYAEGLLASMEYTDKTMDEYGSQIKVAIGKELIIAEKAGIEFSKLEKKIKTKNQKVSLLMGMKSPEALSPFNHSNWTDLFVEHQKLISCNQSLAAEILNERHELDSAINNFDSATDNRKRLFWARCGVGVAVIGVCIMWYFNGGKN